MKKLHQYLTILAAAAFAACSSLDVSDEKAVAENFPSDFDAAVYVSLHPALHSLQIRDYVSAYNAHLKDSLGDAFTEMQKKENEEFIGTDASLGDTAHLHSIFVDKKLVGYSEQQWNDLWLSTTETKTDTIWSEPELASCKLNPAVAEGEEAKEPITLVVIESVTKDADGNYTSITGKTDLTEEAITYELSESTYSIRKGSTKMDSSIIEVKEITIEKQGFFTGKEIAYAKAFNMVGVPKETLYQKLLEVPTDDFAFSYQYVVFGKAHGWAYRPCVGEETEHPIQTEVYPMKKYYCDDNGIAKEI